MVALRSRRLESLFGSPLDRLSSSNIEALTNAGVQESYDLDFKQELYGRKDEDKRSLAADVAALANTAGGAIVIGIQEDDQAQATSISEVEISDDEINRMSQIIAAYVSPYLVHEIIPVPGATADHGFLVVAVPRSPRAPHAVLVNVSMRFPIRNGRTTHYLSEPEVAAAYRDRAIGLDRQVQRLDAIELEATRRINRDHDSWMVTTLVPDVPGDFVITSAVFNEFRNSIQSRPVDILSSASFQRASVGRGRLRADGTTNDSPEAKWALAELHRDGAGVYCLPQYRHSRQGFAAVDGGSGRNVIDDEALTISLLSGILELARHARDRSAAGGNALVRARLFFSIDTDAVEIGHARNHGFPESRSGIAIGREEAAPTAETIVDLDSVAQPGQALMQVAAALANEIGQSFGIAEMGQITDQGELRRRYWGLAGKAMSTWATRYGIPVIDQSLL